VPSSRKRAVVILHVDFDTEEGAKPETNEQIRDRLRHFVDHGAGNGMFTGDGPTIVDSWETEVYVEDDCP
jgi:hypothetical protein